MDRNRKLNQDIDMESEIKSCLGNRLDKTYLFKDDYKDLKPCGSKPGIMYMDMFINIR